MANDITPFRVEVADADLEDLRQRLRRTRWLEPATVADWSQGVPLGYLQDLCRYWAEDYDWRTREAKDEPRPPVSDRHRRLGHPFLHVPSPEPGALPLILTHGWPGSIVEFMEVIGPLTDRPPTVATPRTRSTSSPRPCRATPGATSRPPPAGAWSASPPHGRRSWLDWATAATEPKAATGAHLSRRCSDSTTPGHVAGVHVNLVFGAPEVGQTEFTAEEEDALATLTAIAEWESGYSQQQATRPQTLGYGLCDSPAGQCAWILEKFYSWTDGDNDPVAAFGADRILDNIMLYWLPAAAASSARLYWQSIKTLTATGLGTVDVPAGVSIFPKEIVRAPRHWASRTYTDLRYWHELDRGGHFAAFEQPELFVQEVRDFFRLVR